MTMHLAHPSLSLGGRRKGKQKFRNSEQARQARELEENWNKIKTKWDVKSESKRSTVSTEPLAYSLSAPPGRETAKIASRDTGHKGAVRTRDIPQYSGTEMIGIGQLHKSNGIPIFRKQDAEDLAKMRRN
jgi:hypothetical protein